MKIYSAPATLSFEEFLSLEYKIRRTGVMSESPEAKLAFAQGLYELGLVRAGYISVLEVEANLTEGRNLLNHALNYVNLFASKVTACDADS